jgi:hypothetical protein
MNLKTVKTESDIQLAGIRVEIVNTDAAHSAFILRDDKGGYVEFRRTDWAFAAYVPAPPKMVDRWRIGGTVKKLAFAEDFETEAEALARVEELQPDMTCVPVKVQVPEVE